MAMIGVDCGSWRVLLEPFYNSRKAIALAVISLSASPREVPARSRSS